MNSYGGKRGSKSKDSFKWKGGFFICFTVVPVFTGIYMSDKSFTPGSDSPSCPGRYLFENGAPKSVLCFAVVDGPPN